MVRGYDGLYLHLPFCAARCAYCDFTTAACDPASAVIDAYVDALALKVRRAARLGLLNDVDTVYLGGGTPSFVGAARLSRLLYMMSVSFDLSPEVESTIEMNPDSCTERLVRDLRALGITRISLGVQSLDDGVLRTLGRIHDAQAAREAIAICQRVGLELSVDLMCGIPGQTLESFRTTLDEIVAAGLDHVSVYPLSVEEGTPLARSIAAGVLPPVDEDAQADMMLMASRVLRDAGLVRYEVASYARPGHACRHNLGYWTGADYLGLGIAAASCQGPDTFRALVDGGLVVPQEGFAIPEEGIVRCTCIDDRASFDVEGPMRVEAEALDPRERVCELVMLRMRLPRGVDDREVSAAQAVVGGLGTTLTHLADEGLVEHVGGTWRQTERGWLMGNLVYGAIWDLASA